MTVIPLKGASLLPRLRSTQVPADSVTFRTLISAFEQDQQWEQALALFESSMAEAGVQADELTYFAIIRSLESAGQWDHAAELTRRYMQAALMNKSEG